MEKKPNIVLITIDSLRADFVGFQNELEKNTPFLDSLAKKSYIFTNAIAPANPTFFCFCSLMTGSLPFAFGNYLGIPDNPNIKTVAEVLKKNGYATAAFLGDSPGLYSIYGYQKGFDLYDDGFEETDKAYLSFLEFLWKLREKIPDGILSIIETTRTFIKTIFLSPKHSVSGNQLNEKVIKYFQDKKNKPFFLWLHYMDNHLPYYSGLNKNFFKDKNPLQRLINKLIFYKELSTSLRRMKTKNQKITEIFKEAYRNSIKYTDEQVGKIVSYINRKYPNTVFIVTSDHGEAFMDHGVVGHGTLSLYNELIRVPMIINLPDGKTHANSNTVSLVSLAKTIASIASVKKVQFKGNNLLVDKIFSPINNFSRVLYNCNPQVELGILDNETEIKGYKNLWSFTTDKEKYILHEDGGKEEYYNLSNDPCEKNNLIKSKQKIKSKIIGKLQKIIKVSSAGNSS